METPNSLDFYYIKSNFYRNCPVDGAYGGITPNGGIHLNFFTERHAIPQKITVELQDGVVGRELDKDGKKGIVRELEVGLSMDLKTAIVVRDFMNKMVRILEEKQGHQPKAKGK